MKNLFLLPTDKPSMLWFNDLIDNNELILSLTEVETVNNQNIYITSDEEIKEGDWCINLNSTYEHKELCRIDSQIELERYAQKIGNDCKKIILTTDQDLIADGVQAIDDNFLEWFVKNPSCEKVEVEHFGTCCGNQSITQCINCKKYNPVYKIIIPQEEPKQYPTLENAKLALREYILANKEKVTEDLQEMREKSDSGRDETLEEAAKRTYQKGLQDDVDLTFSDGVKLGAKWQAERMYSEEELKNAIEISVAKALGVMSFTINEESFEQFKKK
jgi:hypothetical protein